MWSFVFVLTLPMADVQSEIEDDEVVFYPKGRYKRGTASYR